MKHFVLIMLTFLSLNYSFAQSNATNETTFFAQTMLNPNITNHYSEIEEQLKAIPFVKLVRVDTHSKTLFLLTQNISSFNESMLLSWLGTYSSDATCIHIGVNGVDSLIKYPREDCNN